MSALMHLVVHATTEHVLAAALTEASGTPEPDADSLLGQELLLRDPETGVVRATVSADQLAVKTQPAREDVLMTARRFAIVDGLPEAMDDEPSVTLDGNDVSVTLASAAPQDLAVWVQVEGDNLVDPAIVQVNIPENFTNADEPLPLPAGNYRVLLLAPAHRAVVLDESVP